MDADVRQSELLSFGALLKRLRIAAKLSQIELAERAHLSRESVSALERGINRAPRRDTLLLLAEALQLSDTDRALLESAAREQRFAETAPPSPSSPLPVPLTTLIGREAEITNVVQSLAETNARLLTLTGPAGVGKTRLAIAVANELLDHYGKRIWLIDLSTLGDATYIPQTIMAALGVREISQSSLIAPLLDHLRQSQPSLMLWDNCEHLLEGCARLAQTLLQACPHLQLLLTSREPTRVRGEVAFQVPALPLPDTDSAPCWHDLLENEAVSLFLSRARMALPQFPVTEFSARTIATICRRLDGMPLAIELAAARVRTLTVEQIAARLDDSLALLRDDGWTIPEHHQALRATLDWSYALLTPHEQALFRRLAVFAGSFSLEAAEKICAGESIPEPEVMPTFLQLVEKSLVTAESSGDQMRYRLLETVRQYARDQLAIAQERVMMQERHRDWYLELAEAAESGLRGDRQQEWLARLDREMENLRAALRWSQERQDGEAGLRMAGGLWFFWYVRGQISEGCRWLEDFLALDAGRHDGPPSALRVKALTSLGILYTERGDFGRAAAIAETCINACKEIGDRAGHAAALNLRGSIAKYQGDYELAAHMYSACLDIRRELGDLNGIATALNNLGAIAADQGDFERATACYQESLAMKREQGNLHGIVHTLNNLSDIARLRGDTALTHQFATESFQLAQELADVRGMATALSNLGEAARQQGDLEAAYRTLEQSAQLFRSIDNTWGVALAQRQLADVDRARGDDSEALSRYRTSLHVYQTAYDAMGLDACLRGIAGIALAHGALATAAQLFGAAEATRTKAHVHIAANDQVILARDIAALREAMPADDLAPAWAAGENISVEQAVALAEGVPAGG